MQTATAGGHEFFDWVGVQDGPDRRAGLTRLDRDTLLRFSRLHELSSAEIAAEWAGVGPLLVCSHGWPFGDHPRGAHPDTSVPGGVPEAVRVSWGDDPPSVWLYGYEPVMFWRVFSRRAEAVLRLAAAAAGQSEEAVLDADLAVLEGGLADTKAYLGSSLPRDAWQDRRQLAWLYVGAEVRAWLGWSGGLWFGLSPGADSYRRPDAPPAVGVTDDPRTVTGAEGVTPTLTLGRPYLASQLAVQLAQTVAQRGVALCGECAVLLDPATVAGTGRYCAEHANRRSALVRAQGNRRVGASASDAARRAGVTDATVRAWARRADLDPPARGPLPGEWFDRYASALGK